MSGTGGEAAFPPAGPKALRGAVCTAWLVWVGVAVLVGPQWALAAQSSDVCDLHFSNGVVLRDVPVARTKAQRVRGLSSIDSAGNGLLFEWDKAEPRIFGMHETHIPLSLGFFDEHGRLFAIEDMEPESDKYYFSFQPAATALELAQGEFKRNRLLLGVRLEARSCFPS